MFLLRSFLMPIPARSSGPTIIVATFAMVALGAVSAAALTITSAKIQIELSHTTSVQLKGTVDDLALDALVHVTH